MIRTLQWLAVLAALFLALGLFTGCSEESQATAPVTGAATLSTSDLASTITQGEIERMTSDGMDPGSAKGIFTVEWRSVFNPQDQSARLAGQALAVGFDAAVQDAGVRRRGVDMGTVSLSYGSGQLTLQKHTGPDGGVAYSSFAGRSGGEIGSSAVRFVSGSSYEFAASGGEKFSALTASVAAPEALLTLSSPAKDASISSSSDLTITWQGGSAGGKILLVVAAVPGRPAGGPPQGGGMPGAPPQGGPPQGGGMRPPGGQGGGMMQPPPMGGQPPKPDSANAIIVRIDGNPGSYTINAAQLQQLVTKTGAKSLRCEVSQMTLQEVAHDGGVVHVVLRNADGARVTLQ
jgi:hypothetical protein